MELGTAVLLLRSMRPGQWAKNVFVLAPLLFALKLGEPSAVLRALAAFALFCLASAAVYLFNDVRDREADALHPLKRERPVASGRLPARTAAAAAVVAALVAAVAAGAWSLELFYVLALYLAVNMGYSLGGKHVPLLDVFMISAGFLLRVIGGGVAIPVPVSGWILVCTFLLSLYLGLGKRLHEMAAVGAESNAARAVLRRYPGRPTWVAFAAAGLAVVAVFSAYTLSARAVANFGTTGLVFTVPLVAAGVIRFALLARDARRAAAPTDALLSDPVTLAVGLAWVAAAITVVYWERWFA